MDASAAYVPLGAIIEDPEAGVSVANSASPALEGSNGVLKVSAVSTGIFLSDQTKSVSLLPQGVRVGLKHGELLVARASGSKDLVAAACLVEGDHPSLFLPDKIWRVRVRDEARDDIRWVYHVLASPLVRRALRRRSNGSSGMMNLSQAAFLALQVPRPALAVQQKLCSLLDGLLALRRLQEKASRSHRRLRHALAQELFGRTRGMVGRPIRLAGVMAESRAIASSGTHARKLTVRLYGRGVLAKTDRRAGSQNTQYYRRRTGQLIYSKLDFLNGAFGIVPPELDGYESTLDLPAFDISHEVNPRWLLHYLSWPGFYRKQLRLANGGRKARRVNPSELLRVVIHVPPRDMQNSIAACLDAIDREIDLLSSLAGAFEKLRRGLIDRLLSGKLAVPIA